MFHRIGHLEMIDPYLFLLMDQMDQPNMKSDQMIVSQSWQTIFNKFRCSMFMLFGGWTGDFGLTCDKMNNSNIFKPVKC